MFFLRWIGCNGSKLVLPLLPEQILFEPPQPRGGRRDCVVQALRLVWWGGGRGEAGGGSPRVVVPPTANCKTFTFLQLNINTIYFTEGCTDLIGLILWQSPRDIEDPLGTLGRRRFL